MPALKMAHGKALGFWQVIWVKTHIAMDMITTSEGIQAEGTPSRRAATKLTGQWAAVQDAADAVAMMAGLAAEKPSHKSRRFSVLIREIDGWQYELAKSQITDMTAMMQPGLAALLATNARGQDATAAALTLWREFYAAREAILGLLPDTGTLGPPRSA